MTQPDATAYGAQWHEIYDDYPGHLDHHDARRAAEMLVGFGIELLELGAGTGRVALAASAAGARVTGVDISAEMLGVAERKPGADQIRWVQGDIRDLRLEQRFDVVACLFNTLLMVPDEVGQLATMITIGEHLRPGGHAVVQTFVPDVSRLDGREHVIVRTIETTGAWLTRSRHDLLSQQIEHVSIRVGTDGFRMLDSRMRFLWPAELRLLGRAAGLEPVAQYANWDAQPYAANDSTCITVLRKPDRE